MEICQLDFLFKSLSKKFQLHIKSINMEYDPKLKADYAIVSAGANEVSTAKV